MQKILIYENRKIDPIVWDISSPELERGAFLDLFNYLDEHWGIYSDLDELENPQEPSLTLKQIEELPDGEVKKVALLEHEGHKRALTDLSESQLQRKLYEKSKGGDAEAAKELLVWRVGTEYQDWRTYNVKSKEG